MNNNNRKNVDLNMMACLNKEKKILKTCKFRRKAFPCCTVLNHFFFLPSIEGTTADDTRMDIAAALYIFRLMP